MEDDSSAVLKQAVDVNWLSFCLVLVILMQAGFACYEVGAIRATSTRSILLKNISDATVSLVAWYMFGYGIAFGKDRGHVIGTNSFFFTGTTFEDPSSDGSFLDCLFKWSFAATCTTVVSGAVADRIPFKAYIVYSFLTSALFYPLLAHAVWADDGWARASADIDKLLLGCGVLDFAGSGVVHMAAGGIGIFIARKVKSRGARFFKAREWDSDSNLKNHTDRPQINEAGFRPNDPAWMTLGCFLLWLGWYGFNCGSTLTISTIAAQNTAGRAAMNTTIGGAWGCIFSMLIELVYHLWSPKYRQEDPIDDPLHVVPFNVDAGEPAGREERQRRATAILRQETLDKIARHQKDDQEAGFTWPFSTHKNLHGAAVNGILAGLVGITAGCATMSHQSAIGVTFVSALLYHVSFRGFICLMIDDAVSAGAIHLVCGAWGLIAAGFTAMDDAREDAGYPPCSADKQTLANLLMAGIIIVYAFGCTWILWGVLRALRLVELAERGEVHAKAEDEDLADFEDRVARHFEEDNRKDNRRLERIEELTRRLNALETNSRTALNHNFEALTNRMDELENARRVVLPVPEAATQTSQQRAPTSGVQDSMAPPSRQKSSRGNMMKNISGFFGIDKE